MHVRVRMFGKPDAIVVVESKLTKIDKFRDLIKDKFNVEPKLQRLFYGGKLVSFTFVVIIQLEVLNIRYTSEFYDFTTIY